MTKCPVCGNLYGVTHSCSGLPQRRPASFVQWSTPGSFPTVHYFRQALAIAQLDDGAIIAASEDKSSFTYGLLVWLTGQCLIFVRLVLPTMLKVHTVRRAILPVILGEVIAIDGFWAATEWGVCHLLAPWLFGARGKYTQLLRPLLLGSVITWPVIIPYVGTPIVGLWNIGLMMVVFENVDGIERMQAFGISVAVGIVFMAVYRMLPVI